MYLRYKMLNLCIFLMLAELKTTVACMDDTCRELEFPSSFGFVGNRLINHVIKTIKVPDQDSCELECYLDNNCVSFNFNVATGTTTNCDLNNSTHKEHEKDLVLTAGYVYRGTNNACGSTPCNNSATCQSGFTRKQYRCLCTPGFTGDHCENDLDTCSEHNPCKNGGKCQNTGDDYICKCGDGFTGNNCEIKFLLNSTILSKDEKYFAHLPEFLAPAVGNDSRWLLCYRASLHGWNTSVFHSQCDGKKHTITVIYKDPYIFGGYTDISWADCPPKARTTRQGRCCVFPFSYKGETYHSCTDKDWHKGWCSFNAVYTGYWAACDSCSSNEFRSTDKAFIFSLLNEEGLGPFKSMITVPSVAIYNAPDFGPTFGSGHDIYIANDANNNINSYTNFGTSYSLPNGTQNKTTILAGTFRFTADEVEVFHLA